ncbi:MAG: molybdopterin biosynthesis protein, partial [Thaumarchaeota archaeon]|nr:molybdopterin biosynthesis protein [Nitrososphaerota archaeon]
MAQTGSDRKIFHRLLSPEEAVARVQARLKPLGVEKVPLLDAWGRVLASDIQAKVDSPLFDRSLVDGYAVRAEDVYEADESNPIALKLVGSVRVGEKPQVTVKQGECAEIATGAPIPPGADAVVMVEYTKKEGDKIWILRGVGPGENVAQTGSDITAGDIVLRKGTRITARELAVLAALGYSEVEVYKTPRIAVFSTGDELLPPSQKLGPGKIYDVNGYAVTTMLRELGFEADYLGILPDDLKTIEDEISKALASYDMVITSGSTSAGLGDVIYRVFERNGEILVHGIRVKPGKPTVIGISSTGKLLVGLPGFPLSSSMIFISVIKPLLIKLAGLLEEESVNRLTAKFPFRVNVGGKTFMMPVQLVESPKGLFAYPRITDSGSVSALLEADGFTVIPEEKQYVDEGEEVEVLLFREFKPPSVAVIGSHCPALDVLLQVAGLWDAKVINVGSMGGWIALKRGEADVAGTHLLDEETQRYNVHMPSRLGIENEVEIYAGYLREIGFVLAPGNPKKIRGFEDLLRSDVVFVNRVKGSGIRTFIDLQLKRLGVRNPEKEIRGYAYQAKTHTAVAAAVADGRADVGVAVGYVAK